MHDCAQSCRRIFPTCWTDTRDNFLNSNNGRNSASEVSPIVIIFSAFSNYFIDC